MDDGGLVPRAGLGGVRLNYWKGSEETSTTLVDFSAMFTSCLLFSV